VLGLVVLNTSVPLLGLSFLICLLGEADQCHLLLDVNSPYGSGNEAASLVEFSPTPLGRIWGWLYEN
jgi:hypothetical protein